MVLIIDSLDMIEECNHAIAALPCASKGDRYKLGRVLEPLRAKSDQRTAGPKPAAARAIFVQRYPAADGPLAEFDAVLARMRTGCPDDWISEAGLDHWLSQAGLAVLWELSDAVAALRAALGGEPAPDLDALLRIAAAGLPPGYWLEIHAGSGRIDVDLNKEGREYGYYPEAAELPDVASKVAFILKTEGFLPTGADPS